MSSSTQEHTPPSSDAPAALKSKKTTKEDADAKADKKKIKILKQALKDEQQVKEGIEQDLKNAHLKIEQLN